LDNEFVNVNGILIGRMSHVQVKIIDGVRMILVKVWNIRPYKRKIYDESTLKSLKFIVKCSTEKLEFKNLDNIESYREMDNKTLVIRVEDLCGRR
jgi:hypothetical protein